MSQRIKEFISLSIVVLFALLILKNIYFNLATFDKLIFLDGRTKDSAAQPIVSAPEPDNKNIGNNINRLEFPKDEGEHKSLQSEWWYFAGHLEDEDNPANKFGVTLMFQKNSPRAIFYLVGGTGQNNFSSFIKFDRYDVLSENNLKIVNGENYWLSSAGGEYSIFFKNDGWGIKLNLKPLKAPFIISSGDDFFYYQQTRLAVNGELFFSSDKKYKVKGSGWIDHEGFKESMPWKSWRWYSLQLDNNAEMAFSTDRISLAGGVSEKGSLFIFKDQKEIISSQGYQIKNLEYWTDQKTGINYPIKWQVDVPERNISLVAVSLVPDQVLNDRSGLYEGTCLVSGIFEGQAVTGRAQFENMP